ncbi:trypsin-like peptidase domain-containing protein [Streptomyces sp. NPDC001595]|uniref:S1C family serine protease n=1 Tax=Streptomyces sp. NPDC001532 TaxID=3154520 RepID=UPI0033177FFD
MNEGKPTQSPSGRPDAVPPPDASDTDADGDFRLGAPAPAVPGASAEGDFELRKPEGPGLGTASPDAAGTAPEPERPAPDAAGTTPSPERPAPDAAGAEESWPAAAPAAPPEGPSLGTASPDAAGTTPEPERSAPDAAGAKEPWPTTAPAPAAASAPAAAPAPAPAAVPAPALSAEEPWRVTAPAPAAPAGAPAPAAAPAPAPSAEAPKPLHDPDPYSTPPYGRPGPWAPAPPVQHPATTPAHGTAIPAVPQTALGMPAPHPTPPAPVAPGTHEAHRDSEGGAPAHGAPPAHGVAPAQAVASAHGVPADPRTGAPGGPAPALGPGESAPAAPGPWQRYDPWAAAAAGPLQQSGAAVPSRQQRSKRAKRALTGVMVLLALVSGVVGGAVGVYLERNGGIGQVELPQAGKEPEGRAPDSVAGIAARALPSVVTLHVSGSEESGTGTGFVLDDRGHILTNNHVVEPAGADGEITVTFHSGDTAEAEVVGRDSGYDLAVVRVRGVSGLEPLPLGNSDNVQVGDPVVAIGAPFDLAGTVTSGIISAKERPITAGGEKGDGSDVSYVDALQTDAPINPGNSGGPLLDSRARVIGINSAIRSADTGGELDGGQSGSIGLGFAIPINQGKRVAEELINTGKATHPVIGVTLDMNYTGDGARVGTKGSDGGSAVTAGGPGDRAGIEPGDVITAVDGQRVHSGEELIVKTRAHRPGDRLELTVLRDGRKRTISLVLGSSGD